MITALPAVPRLATTLVDVRDAADLHLRAMTSPAAAGERFLASTGEPLTFQEVAAVLRSAVGREPAELPVLPDEVVRELAKTDPGMAGMVGELGKVRRVSSEKARTVLGWEPRSNTEALQATSRALQRARRHRVDRRYSRGFAPPRRSADHDDDEPDEHHRDADVQPRRVARHRAARDDVGTLTGEDAADGQDDHADDDQECAVHVPHCRRAGRLTIRDTGRRTRRAAAAARDTGVMPKAVAPR